MKRGLAGCHDPRNANLMLEGRGRDRRRARLDGHGFYDGRAGGAPLSHIVPLRSASGLARDASRIIARFSTHNEADTIYLVGDIVDGWRLKNGWYWPQAHNDVVQKLLRKARKGARVIYVPGNHDEFARDYVGLVFGGVELVYSAVHETADGKKMLIMHGDQFDIVVRNARWLAFLGDGPTIGRCGPTPISMGCVGFSALAIGRSPPGRSSK